jgi:hypothetical protein
MSELSFSGACSDKGVLEASLLFIPFRCNKDQVTECKKAGMNNALMCLGTWRSANTISLHVPVSEFSTISDSETAWIVKEEVCAWQG